jgi:MFS family permease
VIVGLAAIVQVPAAFCAGALVDRFGGVRLLLAGAIAYLAASAILLAPGVEPSGDRLPFVIARVAQGMGIAAVLPAALFLVPQLVDDARRGFGLAFVGSAHNLTLVALPPVSLAILAAASLDAVTWTVAAIVVAGVILALTLPRKLWRRQTPAAEEASSGLGEASRRFGFAYRWSWTGPLAIVLLYVIHWGVVIAYLPQRAYAAGADVGLFFAADGLAVLALRVPSGWLADRFDLRPLMIAGLGITFVAIALLILPPTTPILVLAGLLTGAGAGILLTPLLVEISRRSSDADRGSAFALFSASLAAALVVGSIGVAPFIDRMGFETAIIAALGGLVGAAAIALRERATPATGVGTTG